jgi:hypothetical protein
VPWGNLAAMELNFLRHSAANVAIGLACAQPLFTRI